MKKIKKILLTLILTIYVSALCIPQVNAATTMYTYSFSGSASTFGGKYRSLDHLQGQNLSYVKVVINTTSGDEYDLRLMYTFDFPSNGKILAEKTKLKANGTQSTIYFIPRNGSCPVSDTSKCVVVPVIANVSTANHAISFYDVLYGIEIHNRSWLGGRLYFDVTYSFVNY